jgi:hypothetical protein
VETLVQQKEFADPILQSVAHEGYSRLPQPVDAIRHPDVIRGSILDVSLQLDTAPGFWNTSQDFGEDRLIDRELKIL